MEQDEVVSVTSSRPSSAISVKKNSEHIRVVCRFRPGPNEQERDAGGVNCVEFVSESIVKMQTGDIIYDFEYDKVFPTDTSQEEVYNHVATPMIANILNGYNAAILAYGQTGSGKTYTMQGPAYERGMSWKNNSENWGIAPRLISTLFEKIGNCDPNEEYLVIASYVEIYKEKIRDLLDRKKDNLTILEDKNKGLFVTEATEENVTSLDEAMSVMARGIKNRKVEETNCNTESSRSHAIFLLTIYKHDIIEKETKTSQLYLVDLAGSEKVSKTKSEGARLDEAKTINTSLLALRQVIFALTSGQKGTHVPYRDSKLTRMLQNTFGGNSLTTLIINCSPNSFNDQETLSTLRFGSRTRQITNAPRANKHRTVKELTALLDIANKEISEKDTYIRQLHREVETLRMLNRTSSQHGTDQFYIDAEFRRYFYCPLSGKVLQDPVIATDGYTYDKHAITKHFNDQLKTDAFIISPMTNQRLTTKAVVSNYFVRRQYDYMIERFGREVLDDTPVSLFWTIQDDVPHEVLRAIFSFFDATTLTKCYKVCEEWCRLLHHSESSYLWMSLIYQEFDKAELAKMQNSIDTACRMNTLPQYYWKVTREKNNVQGVMKTSHGSGLYLAPT